MTFDLFNLINGYAPGGEWTAGKCDGSGNTSGPPINPDGHTVDVDCFAAGTYDYSYSFDNGNCSACTETQLTIVDSACMQDGVQINFCNTMKNGVCSTTKVSPDGNYNSGTRVLTLNLQNYTVKCCSPGEPYPDFTDVRWSWDGGNTYTNNPNVTTIIPSLCPPGAGTCGVGLDLDKNYCVRLVNVFTSNGCADCSIFGIKLSPLLIAPSCLAQNNQTDFGDLSCVDVRTDTFAHYDSSIPDPCRTVKNPPANTVITFYYRDQDLGGAYSSTTNLACVDLSAYLGKDLEFYYDILYTFPNAETCGVTSDPCVLHLCSNPLGCLEANCEHDMCRVEHVNLQDIADIPVGFRTGGKWKFLGRYNSACTGSPSSSVFFVDGVSGTYAPNDLVKNAYSVTISKFHDADIELCYKFQYSVTVDGCLYTVIVTLHVTGCCDNECTTISVDSGYRDYKFLDSIVFENQTSGAQETVTLSPRKNTCTNTDLDDIEDAIQNFYNSKGEFDIEVCCRAVLSGGGGSPVVSRSYFVIKNWDCWKPVAMRFYNLITGGTLANTVNFDEECGCSDACSGNLTTGIPRTHPADCGHAGC